LSKNPLSIITDLVLIIPAFTAKLTEASIIEAIDSCTVNDIALWKKKNFFNSMLAKKNKTFNTKGRKDNF